MAAADVQVAPGTPGSPGTWPGCGPPVTSRAASAFPLHRSAPASRLPSISSSPRHASMRSMNVAQLVARAAPRSSTEMMVPPKATSQPTLPAADQCAASQQAAASRSEEAQQTAGTPAMPVCSTSTGTEAGTATPAESHSEPNGWPALRSASLEADELDSAINDLTRSAQLASLPDNYALPEFPGQPVTSTFAAANASAHVTAENSLEHIFDSMGLDDAPGLLRTGVQSPAQPENGAFVHAQHGASASAAPTAAGTVAGGSQGDAHPQPYVLVRLDDKGNILRQATADDIALLTQLLSDEPPVPAHSVAHDALTVSERAVSSKVPRRTGGIQKRSGPSGGTRKPGGPCCHCGVKESPQWRRGPTMKPILCNACGTRYRRTHQLGPANNKSKLSPVLRKGAASSDTQP